MQEKEAGGRKTKKILDLLYPPVCPFCGKILNGAEKSGERGICFSCSGKLPYVEEPCCMKCGKPLREEEREYCADCARHELAFDQGRSLYLHTALVQRAIYQFKFHNKRYYAEIFAREMASRYGKWIRRWEIEEIVRYRCIRQESARADLIRRNCWQKRWENFRESRWSRKRYDGSGRQNIRNNWTMQDGDRT